MRRGPIGSLALAAALLLAGCASTRVDQRLVALSLRDTAARRAFLEGTLRVLDAHPGYVDEFFAAAQRHPATLDRFVQNAAQHLHEPALARMTAAHLAQNPPAVRAIMEGTLDQARARPEVRAAIAAAIESRVDVAAAITTDQASTSRATFRATVRRAATNRQARRNFLATMRANRAALARLLVRDRATLVALSGALLGAGNREVAAALRALERRLEQGPARGGGRR